jgi:hypothetical protein
MLRPAKGINGKAATIVTRMANLVLKSASKTGQLCYVVLDAFFSTGPMFQILRTAVNEDAQQLVHIITRAKKNYVGFLDREFSTKKYDDDDKFTLMDWFDFPEFFTTAKLSTYGKSRTIEYLCLDLLWRPIDDFVRFVCIKDGDGKYVLMCSDLILAQSISLPFIHIAAKLRSCFCF